MLYLDDETAELLGADTVRDPYAVNPFAWSTTLAWRWFEGRSKAVGYAIAVGHLPAEAAGLWVTV